MKAALPLVLTALLGLGSEGALAQIAPGDLAEKPPRDSQMASRRRPMKLYPDSSDRTLVEQMKGRTDKSGQFVLDVEKPADNADAVFEEAQAAEAGSDIATAERLYRRVMKMDPADPAAPFNLGNVLRSSGRTLEVEATFQPAIGADPNFASAWYNLADVLDDQRRIDEAIECLKRALAPIPPTLTPCSIWAFLQRLERHEEAAEWWRRYLALDGNSPWATRAKRALKYCEIQLASPAS